VAKSNTPIRNIRGVFLNPLFYMELFISPNIIIIRNIIKRIRNIRIIIIEMFWLAKNGKSSLFPFSFPLPKKRCRKSQLALLN